MLYITLKKLQQRKVPTDLTDVLSKHEVLTRLVQLNQLRAAEEANGHVRYLRPTYQAPGQQQGAIALATAAVAEATAQLWPAELVRQIKAMREVVTQATAPLTAKQVAAQFIKSRPA